MFQINGLLQPPTRHSLMILGLVVVSTGCRQVFFWKLGASQRCLSWCDLHNLPTALVYMFFQKSVAANHVYVYVT